MDPFRCLLASAGQPLVRGYCLTYYHLSGRVLIEIKKQDDKDDPCWKTSGEGWTGAACFEVTFLKVSSSHRRVQAQVEELSTSGAL